MGKTNTIKKSYLKFVTYSGLDKWYVSYYLNPYVIKSQYPLIELKEVIEPLQKRIKKNDYDGELPVVSKISFKDGKIHLRDENKTGMDLYEMPVNQLLVSKINFHQGAISINESNKLVCSTHYQPYRIDYKKINGQYLVSVLRSYGFLCFLQYLRADGIKNEATYKFIGQLKIPLPSLENQNRIVETYNKKIQLAEQQKQQVTQLEQDIESYFFNVLGIEKMEEKKSKQGLQVIRYAKLSKWALSHFLKKDLFIIEGGKYKTLLLKNIITFFEGGKTPSKARPDFWNGEISWTSPKDFNGVFINKSQDHITKIAVQEAGMKVFPKGIFLSVFRSGILRHSFPTAITRIATTINQDLKAYAVNEDIINKYYFLYFIHTFKDIVLKRASKKSVTVESINTEDFMEIPIPIPPLKIQTEIANTIENMKAKMKTLQQQADKNRKMAIEEFEKEIFQ